MEVVMRLLLLVCISFVLSSCGDKVGNAKDKVINLSVPEDYSGWCFLVGTSDESLIDINKKGQISIGNDGLGYVKNERVLDKVFSAKVYRNNIEETENAKILSVSTHEVKKEEYVIISFYLPENSEDDEKWEDVTYRIKYQQNKAALKIKMIEDGDIIFR